eukprot:GEMP01009301.1.p1 GENE.GEMP01009301.1~~GEMP01009301.1.p1  ORF type:complete len:833 (+),score=208.10 GEMP01009301.1:139-2637(+)
MTTFQRPENALKRADELIAVSKKDDALATLHTAISHRKFRNQWSITHEKIMTQLIGLCVELKNLRVARDSLITYRTMTQAANISSLEFVINLFRTTAEKKVQEAKQSAQNLGLEQIEDLEAFDSPTKVMLNSLETTEARARERSEKTILQWYRFLWETYKAVLDILRSNSRMEVLYHETAQIALEFCRANKRMLEFKRLCDMLRNNWTTLFKKTGPSPPHQTSPNNPETIQKTLETRCVQLKVATELELWRESYVTCEDIHALMVKSRKPKPQMLAQYYEYLSQICWKSESYLFHAFSCLRTFILYHNLRKTWTESERHELASRMILAYIIVPFDQKGFDVAYNDQLAEKNKRMATLFNIPIAPTRQSVRAELQINVLQYTLPVAKNLYDLLEGDSIPLNLCESAQPLLKELEASDNKHLQSYVEPLTRVIFFRLLAQLSKVYANMTLDQFQKAIATVVPLEIAEKWIVSSSKVYGVQVQIDYVRKAIVFGDIAKADSLSSMRQPIMQIGNCLRSELTRVYAVHEQKESEKVRGEYLKDYQKRLDEEKRLIRERREEIEKRKDEREQVELQKEQEEREKRLKQEQEEVEQERLRLADEKNKRELERQALKKREIEMAKNKALLADLSKGGANLMVGGKRLKEIAVADLDKIDAEQIEKAREKQIQKERSEKVRLRKMEAKRVDHLARAIRQEEIKRVPAWREQMEAADTKYYDKILEEIRIEAEKKHQETLAISKTFQGFDDLIFEWQEQRMEEKQEELRAYRLAMYKKAIDKAKQEKIKRAQLARQDGKLAELEKERQKREERNREYQNDGGYDRRGGGGGSGGRSDQRWR